jgi:hypothetical protein
MVRKYQEYGAKAINLDKASQKEYWNIRLKEY